MQPRYPRRSSDNNSNENNRKVKSNTFEGTIDLINGSIQKFLPFRENSVNSPLVLSILLTRIKKKAIFRLLLSPPLRILFKLCPEADDLFFFFFFPLPRSWNAFGFCVTSFNFRNRTGKLLGGTCSSQLGVRTRSKIVSSRVMRGQTFIGRVPRVVGERKVALRSGI